MGKMTKTFLYILNEIHEGENCVRVSINKDAYKYVEDIGYFRLLSLTLNALQGSVVHTDKTEGKKHRHKNTEITYVEYVHLVEVPAGYDEVVEALLSHGFKKV
jgi:hypothetical protein